jgi:hypothetical protein
VNEQRRARYVERAALREAQKAMQRQGGGPLSREELLQLRIQSVEPWKRILVGLTGAAFGGFGLMVFASDDATAGGIALIVLGTALLIAGLVGRRRTVEVCLDQIATQLADAVLSAIANALDGL